jgi:hypothetical protein
MIGAKIRRWVLKIPPKERDFERLGFSEGLGRAKLQRAVDSFFHGYETALEETDLNRLAATLERTPPDVQGFAFEGAGAALALMDHVIPWRGDRWHRFLQGPGAHHEPMLFAGAGIAFAHLPWVKRNIEKEMSKAPGLLKWVVLDGYGFHECFAHWQSFVLKKETNEKLSPYGRRAFDKGLGRCLWFGRGGDDGQVAQTIATFTESRQADLWSGAGMAIAYAGALDRRVIEAVPKVWGPYGPHVAQGAAFAAKARHLARNPCAHTEMACEVLCGLPVEETARIVDEAMENLPPDGVEPAYEVWRRRIQTSFVRRAAHV